METIQAINLTALIGSTVVAVVVVLLMIRRARKASEQRFESSKQKHKDKVAESEHSHITSFKPHTGSPQGQSVLTHS